MPSCFFDTYHYETPPPDSVDHCYLCGKTNVPGGLWETRQKEESGQYRFEFVELVDVQFICDACTKEELDSIQREQEWYDSLKKKSQS